MDNQIICGDCITKLKDFQDNFFDLTIADPPYWKVVSEKWDYQWRTEEDYIEWSKNGLMKYIARFAMGEHFIYLVILGC